MPTIARPRQAQQRRSVMIVRPRQTAPRRAAWMGRASQASSRRSVRVPRTGQVAPSRPPGTRMSTLRRRRPQQSGFQRMVSKVVPSGLAGKTASKTASTARKPAGMALLAGAAGLAFKNRDKIAGMLGRKRSETPAQPGMSTTTDMPERTAPRTDAGGPVM